MHARSLLAATLFALTSFVVASPPGCLLGAVNTYSEPADIKSVCSEKDVTKTIAKFCGDSSKQALVAFADICNGAGVKVGTYSRLFLSRARDERTMRSVSRHWSLEFDFCRGV
jgi:hypothetical protein